MSDEIFPVRDDWRSRAYIDARKYEEMYARAEKDPMMDRIDFPSTPSQRRRS